MNKLCLPYRHLFFIFLAFISLSFSFTSKVEATTQTSILISDTDFSYLDNLDTMISTSEAFIQSNSDGVFVNNNFCITREFSSGTYYMYTGTIYGNSPYFYDIKTSTLPDSSFNGITFYHSGGAYVFSSDFSSFSGIYNSSPGYLNFYKSSNKYLLYCNFDLNFTSTKDFELNFIHNDLSFTSFDAVGSSVPTLYFLHNYFYPPDDTPLLTSFYETTLDRLSYLCDYIVSSYLFLAIFSIFILYFVILLIRRLR